MVIYERGNAAKQAIFLALDRLASSGEEVRVLDLACGDGRLWGTFLDTHPNVSVIGIDTDAQAIQRGEREHAHSRLHLRVLDAQKPLEDASFQAVVAFSAIEHVVDRPAFLRTVWQALLPGGRAFLNYDAGHFRSWDLKERLMVPVSQLLAYLGIEGPYMKRVDDKLFTSQVLAQGFTIEAVQKYNLHPLKGFFRGATDEALVAWVEFEQRLNALYTPQVLDEVMWSTTFILQKP